MTASAHAWGRGLLVSVRDAGEAAAAASGGAAIVDVKEPARGPLGRADAAVAAAVVTAVPHLPVTLACGELAAGVAEIAAHVRRIDERLAGRTRRPLAVKAGPAGLDRRGWARGFRELLAALPGHAVPVAVAYADWRRAGSPPPGAILAEAVTAGAAALLVDTFAKADGDLFSHAPVQELRGWIAAAAANGLTVALAGRLDRGGVARAVEAGAGIVGVRSAACRGGRLGRVDVARVRALATLVSDRVAVASSTAESTGGVPP